QPVERGEPLAPGRNGRRRRAQVGDRGRDALESRPEGQWQAAERTRELTLGHRLAALDEGAAHRERAEQGLEDRLHLEDHAGPGRFQERDVAAELQRVAESLLRVHIKGAAREWLGAREARQGWGWQAVGRRELEACLVQRPARSEITESQT